MANIPTKALASSGIVRNPFFYPDLHFCLDVGDINVHPALARNPPQRDQIQTHTFVSVVTRYA
jgi:hypothetical protein